MTKKQTAYIVTVAVVLSLVLNALFGRWLEVKFSTWPLLNRWKLISPQAPIVINTREEVRVDDAADIQQAAANARPKLSLVLSNTGGSITALGAAINLTSDGYVLTAKSVIEGQKPGALFLKLDDGSVATVTASTLNSASGVVILKTTANNLSVANLGDSSSLAAGQRLVFLQPGAVNFSVQFAAGFVSNTEAGDVSVKDADAPALKFTAQGSSGAAGQAVVDTAGNIVGLWDGSAVISSDVLKDVTSNFLGNNHAFVEPEYGFHYHTLSLAEQQLLAEPDGDKVTDIAAAGPAQKAGLLAGDIIQAWNGSDLNGSVTLEQLLPRSKPGDIVSITVLRGKNQINLSLTVGQQK